MKDITAVVHHQIKNYELTSRSRELFRLRPQNEARISKRILDKKLDKQLLELLLKRDRLNRKINEMLDKAAEINDPKKVTDFQEAESFIKRFLLTETEKADQIHALIEKHKNYQSSIAKQRQDIIEKHSKTHMRPLASLSKFSAVQQHEVSQKERALQSELHDFYVGVADSQRTLAFESENMLRHLGVPFFALEDPRDASIQPEKLSDLKAKVLELLSQSFD